jgi:hypothetical protein
VEVWEVPDPVNPRIATALQVLPLPDPAPRAVPKGNALCLAGRFVAEVFRMGCLSGDYILDWLANNMDNKQRAELLRETMDPGFRFNVPILGVAADGWWFQITRRLTWITSKTESEGRLVELLLNEKTTSGETPPLVAVEPILIVAPMTRQPVNWAFSARLWGPGVTRPIDRPWRTIAKAVHHSGIPTIALDHLSTIEEVACQMVMKGYWHGYVEGDEH